MFLHLGRDVAVADNSIVVIFDMDTATWSRYTRNYLTAAEKAGKVYVITDELLRKTRAISAKETEYIPLTPRADTKPVARPRRRTLQG